MFRKILVLFFIIVFNALVCKADFVVDDSIHSDIANKYELEKLPDLPANIDTVENIFTPNEFETKPDSKYVQSQNEANSVQKTSEIQDINIIKENVSVNIEKNPIGKIKKGEKFVVVNNSALSDKLKKGTEITFVSKAMKTSKNLTIPKGTVFKGTIIDSHQPKITGNGGLLVIKVDKLIYNGKNYDIKAKITMVNQKHIFFNNIKGERKFFKNAKKSGTKGKKYFDKMWGKAKIYYAISGFEKTVAPIAAVTGAVVYSFDLISAPVVSFFSKGGSLSIPKNTTFEIKMLESTVLYK